jgi:hypothetical protein
MHLQCTMFKQVGKQTQRLLLLSFFRERRLRFCVSLVARLYEVERTNPRTHTNQETKNTERRDFLSTALNVATLLFRLPMQLDVLLQHKQRRRQLASHLQNERR